MELIAVTQAISNINEKKTELTQTEKEFVAQFIFRTGDGELTNKLIEELIQPGADRQRIFKKFEIMVELPSDWIQKLEELLIALEMYRIQGERTAKLLTGLLSGCHVSIMEESNRIAMEREESERKREKEFLEKGETYVGRNTTGGTDHPSRL